jgi:hypothetical protein
MLKLSRRGGAPPRSHTHAQLLVPLWKLSKRREVRSLKFVMLLERLLCGIFFLSFCGAVLFTISKFDIAVIYYPPEVLVYKSCFAYCNCIIFNGPEWYLMCKFTVRSRSALRRPKMRRRPRRRRWRNLRRHNPREVLHRRVLKARRSAVAVGSVECHHRHSSVN